MQLERVTENVVTLLKGRGRSKSAKDVWSDIKFRNRSDSIVNLSGTQQDESLEMAAATDNSQQYNWGWMEQAYAEKVKAIKDLTQKNQELKRKNAAIKNKKEQYKQTAHRRKKATKQQSKALKDANEWIQDLEKEAKAADTQKENAAVWAGRGAYGKLAIGVGALITLLLGVFCTPTSDWRIGIGNLLIVGILAAVFDYLLDMFAGGASSVLGWFESFGVWLLQAGGMAMVEMTGTNARHIASPSPSPTTEVPMPQNSTELTPAPSTKICASDASSGQIGLLIVGIIMVLSGLVWALVRTLRKAKATLTRVKKRRNERRNRGAGQV